MIKNKVLDIKIILKINLKMLKSYYKQTFFKKKYKTTFKSYYKKKK